MARSNLRILFLYSELADYFLSNAQHLSKQKEVEIVRIVHWPKNEEAPFAQQDYSPLTLCLKSSIPDLEEYCSAFQPSIIFCSGWMDRDYNAIAEIYSKKNIPVIVGIDNHWRGTFKQMVGVFLFKKNIRKKFNKAWLAGEPQVPYAKKFGFKDQDLLRGVYCANMKLYNDVFASRCNTKIQRKLVYIGRYVEEKGVDLLWRAFQKISRQHPSWELHCFGTGILWQKRIKHPSIIHHGFVQPKELITHIQSASGFILPSRFEPWGVVVHEMATAGVPLLLSAQVGASSAFLIHNRNGYSFSDETLESTLHQFLSLSDEDRTQMGLESRELSQRITPNTWSKTLLSVLDTFD